jgi:hypothetical protein
MWYIWGKTEDNTVVVGKPEGKSSLGTPRSRRGNTIKTDSKEINGRARSGLIWLRVGQVAGSYKYGNECMGSKNCGKLRSQLRNY